MGATKPTYLVTDLVAGENTMILIDLMVNALATNTNITNASEIRSASNENGIAVDDEDSTPDNVDGDDVIDRTERMIISPSTRKSVTRMTMILLSWSWKHSTWR